MTTQTVLKDQAIPDVSILIVNYNGLRFLEECFEAIKTAFGRYSYEIVVVDNDSSDGSREYLSTRTDIRYIESKENLGFTGGNNLAARHACGRVLLLLNNDTKIQGLLDPLIDQALQGDIGASGSRLVYGDGRIQFSVGFHHSPLRLVLSWLGLEKRHWLPSIFRRLETDPSYYQHSHRSVAWVSGACLATRREIWEQLGGFDETFFMYCEDVDYCLRIRQAGFLVSFVTETLVTHYEGAGRPWIGKAALQRTAKSYLIFSKKHFGKLSSRFTALGLALLFSFRALAFFGQALLCQDKNKKNILREKVEAYWLVSMQFANAFFGKVSKEALV